MTLVAIFLGVIPIAMVNTGLTPLLLVSTPPQFLGRVIAGVRFGAIDTVFLCTGLLIMTAGVYAAFALPPEPAPPEAAVA